jgi:hypothetical protein
VVFNTGSSPGVVVTMTSMAASSSGSSSDPLSADGPATAMAADIFAAPPPTTATPAVVAATTPAAPANNLQAEVSALLSHWRMAESRFPHSLTVIAVSSRLADVGVSFLCRYLIFCLQLLEKAQATAPIDSSSGSGARLAATAYQYAVPQGTSSAAASASASAVPGSDENAAASLSSDISFARGSCFTYALGADASRARLWRQCLVADELHCLGRILEATRLLLPVAARYRLQAQLATATVPASNPSAVPSGGGLCIAVIN